MLSLQSLRTRTSLLVALSFGCSNPESPNPEALRAELAELSESMCERWREPWGTWAGYASLAEAEAACPGNGESWGNGAGTHTCRCDSDADCPNGHTCDRSSAVSSTGDVENVGSCAPPGGCVASVAKPHGQSGVDLCNQVQAAFYGANGLLPVECLDEAVAAWRCRESAEERLGRPFCSHAEEDQECGNLAVSTNVCIAQARGGDAGVSAVP